MIQQSKFKIKQIIMGCGTSLNENEVNKPSQPSFKSEQDFKSTGVISAEKKAVSETLVRQPPQEFDMKENQEPIVEKKEVKEAKEVQEVKEESGMNEEQVLSPVKKLFLFGQTSTERKIVSFNTSPLGFDIINSRNNNPSPTKYAPTQVILQQSQELFSSHLFCSTSHPPYNFMFATYIKPHIIFLCGGVNFDFDNVSNEAFLYNSDKKMEESKPHKKKERGLGNNLMGINFQKLALMKKKRYSHMGVFMRAGKLSYVFVLGGRTENDEIIKTCEKYSFQENKWTSIADLNMPRSTGFAMIFNSKIYVFGGYVSEGKRTKKIQRYNSIQDSWEVLNIKLHRGIETGLIFPSPTNGEVLLVGGNVEYGALKTVVRLNFKDQEYGWDSDMKKERLLQKGINIKDQNMLYVFGGDFEDSVEKYSFKEKSWKIMDKLSYTDAISPDDINYFTFAQETININTEFMQGSPKKKEVNQDMKYRYIFGTDDYPSIYQLNITKWVLKRKSVPMTLRLRCFMTIAKIKEGKYFIGGGTDSSFEKASKAAYLYYSGTNKAIEIGKMKQKKYEFAATALENFIYLFGGRVKKEGEIIAACEKFDLKENKWVQLPDMPRQRATHQTVLVEKNKKILIFGGTDSYQSVNEIDIFDTQTDTFSTLKQIVPIPLDLRAIYCGDVMVEKVILKKKEDDFQFLEEEGEEVQKKQEKVEEEKGEVFEEEKVKITAFSYNYFLKQYNVNSLTVSLNGNEEVVDNKQQKKVLPFSLSFKEKVDNDDIYYSISEKGVFKWKEGKEVQPQIVINQIQMLQMPLEKFSIA